MERKTPLYDRHVALNGKMTPYAGYLLPVQYAAGVIREHNAVRTACGLFDVSHMGEVWLAGNGALATLQRLLTNDMSGMRIGQVRYSPMCDEAGGTVDDVIVYRTGETDYLVVVNAANREKDVVWIKAHLCEDTDMRDASDETAQLALQGPRAAAVLAGLVTGGTLPKKYYTFADQVTVAGIPCLVSRTGYTGEDGFELYVSPQYAPALWDALLAAGAPEGIIPCGLAARDTLRLEAGMPLYGHELSHDISPLEAGLAPFVKPQKGDFIGRDALASNPLRRRIGLTVTGRGIAREGCVVWQDGKAVGTVTSGTHAPYLGVAIAMALVVEGAYTAGQPVDIDVRGRMLRAEEVPLPFYKRAK